MDRRPGWARGPVETKGISMNVSVVIPTYRRPEMLAQTLESVFRQTVPPFEILIGDDSPDDETERMVERIARGNTATRIRYFHHRPALKELKNVDHLYSRAEGELILHMHDDDPLFECCVEALRAPLLVEGDAVASFGLQRLIDESRRLRRSWPVRLCDGLLFRVEIGEAGAAFLLRGSLHQQGEDDRVLPVARQSRCGQRVQVAADSV